MKKSLLLQRATQLCALEWGYVATGLWCKVLQFVGKEFTHKSCAEENFIAVAPRAAGFHSSTARSSKESVLQTLVWSTLHLDTHMITGYKTILRKNSFHELQNKKSQVWNGEDSSVKGCVAWSADTNLPNTPFFTFPSSPLPWPTLLTSEACSDRTLVCAGCKLMLLSKSLEMSSGGDRVVLAALLSLSSAGVTSEESPFHSPSLVPKWYSSVNWGESSSTVVTRDSSSDNRATKEPSVASFSATLSCPLLSKNSSTATQAGGLAAHSQNRANT